MADKVIIPGAFGLVNYRSHFSRPIEGRVTVRGAGRQATMRRAGVNRWRPYNPRPYIPEPFNQGVSEYTGTNYPPRRKSKTRYKKRTCCRYRKGKKYCSPRYCSKKYYWY